MDVKVPLIVQRLYRATESVCRVGLGVCELLKTVECCVVHREFCNSANKAPNFSSAEESRLSPCCFFGRLGRQFLV